MARPTIKDISKLTGVSPTAVSFALNGRPGISEQTRERVIEVARTLGWRPSAAAIALSAGRAAALGLVIARPEETFTNERFFMQLIAGVERVLTRRSMALLLQFASHAGEEIAVYRRWHAESRVDGVLLIDVQSDDPRPTTLVELGLPFVAVGSPVGYPHPSVEASDDVAMREMVAHFADNGHRRLAYVAGDPAKLHTQQRMRAFEEACAQLGLESLAPLTTDYSEAAGTALTEALLDHDPTPTGIIFDNEVLMTGGVIALAMRGLGMPSDVAVASFEDSPLCRILSTPVTAMERDPSELGSTSAKLLLDVIAGAPDEHRTAPAPRLVARGSTAPVNP